MDYSKQGSWDSYSSQVHNLYPYPQPTVYPPQPVSEGYGYQTYFGEENPSYGWSQQQPAAPSDEPYNYGYNDDPDCLTFLRGCLAGLCCCCLLEQCCCYY